MKKYFICILLFAAIANANAGDRPLEKYISSFDYAARKEMKIDSQSLIKALKH